MITANKNITVISREMPHYRIPIYEKLAQNYNYRIVVADNIPNTNMLNSSYEFNWLNKAPFIFNKKDAYTCIVPLRSIIKKFKSDLILIECGSRMSSTWVITFIWPLLKKVGIKLPKVIFWGHGTPVRSSKNKTTLFLSKILRKLMLKSADGYLAYTEDDTKYLKNLNTPCNIDHFNNTIDISEILKLRDIDEHRKGESKHILMVGRLLEDKKFHDAILSMHQVWLKHPSAELTIIGGGDEDYIKYLKFLAGDELNKRIHLTGPIYKEHELAKYYNRSQLFWLTGAAGLGVNHAIAYGLPVLAYKQDATDRNLPKHHPEISYVKEGATGWIVQNADKSMMTNKAIELLSLSKTPRDSLGKELIEYASNHLDINISINRINNFIKTVIDG